MTKPGRLTLGVLVGTLLAGCAGTMPGTPSNADFGMEAATPERSVLLTASGTDGGTFVVRPDAPWAGIPAAAKLPAGQAVHLDFFSRKPNTPVPQGANKVWYKDGVPFSVRFVAGNAFAVTDGDASDGTAVVTVAKAAYDAYVGTTGKPGGSVAVTDPIFFQKGTLTSITTKPVWNRLGLRALPLLASYRRGDYTLSFAATGLETGFSMRFVGTTGAVPAPPAPPAIQALSGPDRVAPGAGAALTATVVDPNPETLVYQWSAKGPAAAAAPTGQAAATWTAPTTVGLYQLGLTVTDPYFVSTADPTLPVWVEVPAAPAAPATRSTTGGGWVIQNGAKVTFSFNARQQADGTARGNFQLVQGSGKTLTKFNGDVTTLKVEGTTATATGTLDDGKPFLFVAKDLGEGAKAIGADRLTVVLGGPNRFDLPIAGGNIQVR